MKIKIKKETSKYEGEKGKNARKNKRFLKKKKS